MLVCLGPDKSGVLTAAEALGSHPAGGATSQGPAASPAHVCSSVSQDCNLQDAPVLLSRFWCILWTDRGKDEGGSE